MTLCLLFIGVSFQYASRVLASICGATVQIMERAALQSIFLMKGRRAHNSDSRGLSYWAVASRGGIKVNSVSVNFSHHPQLSSAYFSTAPIHSHYHFQPYFSILYQHVQLSPRRRAQGDIYIYWHNFSPFAYITPYIRIFSSAITPSRISWRRRPQAFPTSS